VECGQGRRPCVEKSDEYNAWRSSVGDWNSEKRSADGGYDAEMGNMTGAIGGNVPPQNATITGYACACPTPDQPTRPAVVLDPFAGTGTTIAVANHLGRYGIGLDLSADYLRVARWRINDPKLRAKVLRVDAPPPVIPGQIDLFA